MNAVFKALSDPTRRQVLQLLRQGPKTAGELSDHFPVSKPTMSAHFAVLREAGLATRSDMARSVCELIGTTSMTMQAARRVDLAIDLSVAAGALIDENGSLRPAD